MLELAKTYRMRRGRRFSLRVVGAFLVLLAVCAVCALAGCGAQDVGRKGLIKSVTYPTTESFDPNTKTIAVETGSIYGDLLENLYPDAQIRFYPNIADMLQALETGKIDGFLADAPIVRMAAHSIPGIAYIGEDIMTTDTAVAFVKSEKGERLQKEFNAFLASLKEDRTLDALQSKWFADVFTDDSVPNVSDLEAKNGTINLVVSSSAAPFVYVGGDKFRGYEIELITLFCQNRGYGLDIQDTDFSGLLASISSGKSDIGISSVSITPERQESMLFSEGTYTYPVQLFVKQTEEDVADSMRTVSNLADLKGKRAGVLMGSIYEKPAAELVGTAGEIISYSSFSDLVAALRIGEIDAFVYDGPQGLKICSQYPGFTMLKEYVQDIDFGMVFQCGNERSAALCEQMNAFIASMKSSGKLKKLQQKWMHQGSADIEAVDYSELLATNGVVHAVTSTQVGAPVSYTVGNIIVGYEIEILTEFCRENGYGLDISAVEFNDIIASVEAGKYDIGCSGIIITPEREERVLFSSPVFEGGAVCVVKNGYAGMRAGFFSSFVESFEKTFMREGRWQLFLGGVWDTMLITVASLIFGTALGFLVYLWCRKGGRIRNAFVGVIVWLIQGMPAVVFLMVLFYIVFGSSSLSGISVSIVCFTFIFAASVIGLLRVGELSVDEGQVETATILGYSRNKAFFRIVLPQIVRHILPAYRAEMVSLLKGTAVVGYIAVQDLTKIGDIVRSRTYEAFFPLIAVAAIYFILAAMLEGLVNLIARATDSEKRSPEIILRGLRVEGEEGR